MGVREFVETRIHHEITTYEKMRIHYDMSYLSHACIDEELNDLMFERNINELDEDEISEFILKSRAMLGDENRELYDDGEHTDFEEVERYWKGKHDAQDEYEFQLNSDILDF